TGSIRAADRRVARHGIAARHAAACGIAQRRSSAMLRGAASMRAVRRGRRPIRSGGHAPRSFAKIIQIRAALDAFASICCASSGGGGCRV
ncbi:hypothetical protein NX871_30380, partial [Burkholderia thailandensis]|uniref:hypothetical protein n=1 Tax=Burkholderia thailandensis TaxID=57975 RepID=UPI00217E516F